MKTPEADPSQRPEANLSEVRAELLDLADRYEQALINNQVAVLDALFWNSPEAVRLGATEELFGAAEIAAFRRARPSAGLARTRTRTEVTAIGADFGVTTTLFTREGVPGTGRQQQTWVRFPDSGWRIVAAHVSQRP